MTTVIADQRAALVVLVKTVSALSGRAYDYFPPLPPDPCVVVGLPTAYSRATLSGAKDLVIPVYVMVAITGNRPAETRLEALIDPVWDAIETSSAYMVAGVKDFSIVKDGDGKDVQLMATIEVAVNA